MTARRQRIQPSIGDTVPLAFERDRLLCPQPPHQLDLLLRSRPSIMEIRAERLVLDGVPTGTHTEAQSPACEHVETGGLFRDERGLTLRKDDDCGHELEMSGQRGEVAEQYEWLVELAFRGVRTTPVGSRRGP